MEGRGRGAAGLGGPENGRGWTIFDSSGAHSPHLFVPIAASPEGVRTAACPVCHEPTPVPRRTRWLQFRCRACGTEFVATDGTPAPPPVVERPKPRPRERVFFRELGVLVTDARLVADGRTVTLDTVTSCRTDVEPGGWRWPPDSVWAVVAAIALLAAAAPGATLALASSVPTFPRILCGAVAAALLVLAGAATRAGWREGFYRFDRYRLVLGTTGAEFPAFSDADEELVGRVAAAVKEALATRRW